jgi:hypothetical protein
VADASAALDLECYLSDGQGAVSGGDLCATAAQSINNAAWDDYDFVITETSRAAGDQLFFRVKVAIVDASTGTDHVTAWLGRIQPLIDVRS